MFIITMCALLIGGCRQPSVLSRGHLPVYGTDPLMHTVYLGSDEHYHHFALQKGKSRGIVIVPVADAQIKPESFALDSSRQAFVKGTKPGAIELIVLSGSR